MGHAIAAAMPLSFGIMNWAPGLRAFVLPVMAGVVSGCVGPAPDTPAYREKAAMSVEAALSEVSSTRVSVEQLLAQRMLNTYADVVITDSESALGNISSAFGSVQPPTKVADGIRDSTTQVLSQAEDAVTAARVSARRGDRPGLEQALSDLRQVERDLGAAETQLQ